MPRPKPIIDPHSDVKPVLQARPAGLAFARHRATGSAPARTLLGAVGVSALLLAAALAAQVPSGGP